MHSEKEPDAEERNRRKGAGVQAANAGLPGLGGRGCPCSKGSGRPGCVCGGPGGARQWRQAPGVEWGGKARPTASVGSPQWLSRPGYSSSGTPEFKQLRGWGWSRTREECLIQHWRPCGGGVGALRPAGAPGCPPLWGNHRKLQKKHKPVCRPLRLWGFPAPLGFMFCVYKIAQITLPLNVLSTVKSTHARTSC